MFVSMLNTILNIRVHGICHIERVMLLYSILYGRLLLNNRFVFKAGILNGETVTPVCNITTTRSYFKDKNTVLFFADINAH